MTSHYVGHSSDVRMHLIVNGDTIPLAQLGPDMVILDAPIELPPTDAEIVLSIDGRVDRWPVGLVEGASLDSKVIKLGPPNGRGDGRS